MKQITDDQKALLEKQQYRLVGNHSAVKICGWTKKKLIGQGTCYKETFYGIRSHQCLQMTTSMYCANRCMFCWRGLKSPVSKEWYGDMDEPEEIINESIKQHLHLLNGYPGNDKADQELVKEMKDVKHVALSLTGEAITYPKINEFCKKMHDRKISTFIVTNGQFPELMDKLIPVTQLYISLDAPNKELLKQIDNPMFPDYYERMLKSLDLLKNRQERTCIRLTIVKDINDNNWEEYADLIKRGSPDFIEVKAYMWVGESQERLDIDKMPRMEEIKNYTDELLKHLPDYELEDQHDPSRVTLLMKKSLNKKRFIDFKNFFENKTFAEDYSSTDLKDN